MINFPFGNVTEEINDLKEEPALNIMDGMDAARYTSANPHDREEKETTQMPMVLRNLNNKSDLDSTSPQTAQDQMAQQPPALPE